MIKRINKVKQILRNIRLIKNTFRTKKETILTMSTPNSILIKVRVYRTIIKLEI